MLVLFNVNWGPPVSRVAKKFSGLKGLGVGAAYNNITHYIAVMSTLTLVITLKAEMSF